MIHTARMAVAAAVVTVSTLFLVPSALACTCGPPPPVPVALERAEMVLEAKVVAGPDAVDAGSVTYTFDVVKAWKGNPGAQVTITTAVHSAACGRSYAKGSSWLLYPYSSDDGVLRDNICSRSAPVDAASADLAELGEPTRLTGGGATDVTAPAEAPAETTATAEETPVAEETPAAEETPVEETATTEATEPAEEPAAGAEPEPAEPADEIEGKPGCSMAAGSGSLWLLLVPLAGLLRRRS